MAKPAKKVPAKKAVAKKTAAKKSVPAKKVPTKKAAAAVKAKSTDKASKAIGGQGLPRDLNEHGLVKGSEGAVIMDALLEGGADRIDVNAKVLKALGKKTTVHGNTPNVSSLIANLLRRMKEKGYTIDSHWVLVPPTPASKAAATKAKKRAAAKADKAEVADSAPAVKATKKVPAKKAAKRPSKK